MPDLFTSAAKLQKRLAKAGFPSAVIGGLANSIWGEPRATRDADLKVLVRREQAADLIDALGDKYQVIQDYPVTAIRRLGYVFVRDADQNRLDLLFTDTSFDEQVIQRSRKFRVLPRVDLIICTAEDLIVYKMLTTRGRDIDDVRSIIKRQGNQLDDAYVLKWLHEFEIAIDDTSLISTYNQLRKHK